VGAVVGADMGEGCGNAGASGEVGGSSGAVGGSSGAVGGSRSRLHQDLARAAKYIRLSR
jgi:hypothetical protein